MVLSFSMLVLLIGLFMLCAALVRFAERVTGLEATSRGGQCGADIEADGLAPQAEPQRR